LALLLIAALGAPGCRRQRTIPDDDLTRIFHDAFLSNAYLDRNGGFDSLNLYEPIFAHYGYTTEDVQYTIGNFSRRKSARLGDVVERAIQMLERESKGYEREVTILDTIENRARRFATRTVRYDSVVRLRQPGDTARARLTVANVRPGTYRVTFDYRIDSLDGNRFIRSYAWTTDRSGKTSFRSPYFLTHGRDSRFERELETDSTTRSIHVDLYDVQGRMQRPRATFRNLRITYTPPVEQAVDSFYRHQLNLRIFADDFCNPVAADRRTLSADSLGIR